MTGSVWGLPIDASDIARDTAHLLEYVKRNNKRFFERELKFYRGKYLAELLTYMTVIAIGIQKANDPVDGGLKMDIADQQALRYAVDKFAHPSIADTVYSLIWKVSTGEYADITRFINTHYHSSEWQQTLEAFWTLGKVVQWMREGSTIHSRLAVRAALLRLMLASAQEYLKNHPWTDADLPAAADLTALLNDRNMQPPGDYWV